MANVIWISPPSRLQRAIRWKQNHRRTRLRFPSSQGRNPSPKSRTSGGKNFRQSRSRPHLPLHPRPQARSPYPQSRTRGKKISRSITITITPTPLDATGCDTAGCATASKLAGNSARPALPSGKYCGCPRRGLVPRLSRHS